MATLRLFAVLAASLCVQALLSDARRPHGHHHLRSRRQTKDSNTFDALARKIHFNTNAMTAHCKSAFAIANGRCLSASYDCLTKNDGSCSTAKLQQACRLDCPASATCSLSAQLLSLGVSPASPQTSVQFCLPQPCRSSAFKPVLTSLTSAIFRTLGDVIAKRTGGLFNPIQAVNAKCGYTQVACTSSKAKECSFRQFRAIPTLPKPIDQLPPKINISHPVFHILNHTKSKYGDILDELRKHNSKPHYPTGIPTTIKDYDHIKHASGSGSGHSSPSGSGHGSGSGSGRHPEYPHHQGSGSGSGAGHASGSGSGRFPGRPTSGQGSGFGSGAHPAYSTDSSSAASGDMCGNEQCPSDMACCKLGNEELGCCPSFVDVFLDEIIETPLHALSESCGKALAREKAHCLTEYVQCMDKVTSSMASVFSGKNSLISPDFEKLGMDLASCQSIHTCLTRSDSGGECRRTDLCTVNTKISSEFSSLSPSEKPSAGNTSICLPDECMSQSDLQDIASLLFDLTCGPFCVVDKAFVTSKVPGNIFSSCPVEKLSLQCRSVHVSQIEEKQSDICEETIELSDKMPNFGVGKTAKNTHHHGDGEKSSVWMSTWFIIGVVCGSIVVVMSTLLLLRWHIVSRRRHEQARVLSYAHLNDETAGPDGQ